MKYVYIIVAMLLIMSENIIGVIIGIMIILYAMIHSNDNKKENKITDNRNDDLKQKSNAIDFKENNSEIKEIMLQNKEKNNQKIKDNFIINYYEKIEQILEIGDKKKTIIKLEDFIKTLECENSEELIADASEMISDLKRIIDDYDNFYYNYKHSIIKYSYTKDDELSVLQRDPFKLYIDDYKENNNNVEEDDCVDKLYSEIKKFVIKNQKASASLLQRKFRISYNKAATMIDKLEEDEIIGPSTGNATPREVLVQYSEQNDEE